MNDPFFSDLSFGMMDPMREMQRMHDQMNRMFGALSGLVARAVSSLFSKAVARARGSNSSK